MTAEYKNDFEEDDTSDDSQVDFLQKKQRELISSTIDYNLGSISQLIHKNIDLAPQYQRRFRWDDKRKSRLIESFLMSVPIPPIFLNEDDLGQYSVIDGKQRLSAISEFLLDKLTLTGLEVFKDLNGLVFNDLPKEFQNSLTVRANIRAIIILRQSDKDIKYEVFQRLNTGGVHLNAQEIRNSAFPSELNNQMRALSETKKFQEMLGIKSKVKSRLYQEMKDVELVLRFFALKDNWTEYVGGLKKVLDSYMDDNKTMGKKEVKELKESFVETATLVAEIFGNDGSYRRWLPDNKKWKQQISTPLYDAQMFACYKKDKAKVIAKKSEILTEYKKLFSNDDVFIESIASSTGTPVRFLYRVNALNKIIEDNI